MNPSVPNHKKHRFLILTAGFGEGHNSAANHMAESLKSHGEVLVSDPCASGAPWLNARLRDFYRMVTTHTPQLWYRIYLSTEKQDFSKQNLPFMRKPETFLAQQIEEFRPTAIISTYPLYPYFCERIFAEGFRCPVYTIITDSIEINAAWRKAPTDLFFVTDQLTRNKLVNEGLSAEKIIAKGFPVHPRFSKLSPLPADSSTSPFRILYFPTPKKPHVRRTMRALLEAHPDIHVTVVLGKNVRKLYRRAKEISHDHPNRVKLIGWTRKVPELLVSHHLVIGKAGGATVHEAIAAQTPMLIHHLVPGQEEGNLALLEHIGAGQLTASPNAVTQAVQNLLKDNAKQWRHMKQQLSLHSKPSASDEIARFILDHSGLG